MAADPSRQYRVEALRGRTVVSTSPDGMLVGGGRLSRARASSRQHGLNHAAMNIGEAVVAATKAVGQPLMINSQQVQQRGM